MDFEFSDDECIELTRVGTQLGRSAYRIDHKGEALIVKRQPVAQSLISRLSRRLFGGSLPFRNEQFVNAELVQQQYQYTHFKFPRMLSSKENCYLVFELIPEATEGVAAQASGVTMSLFELNITRISIARSWLEQRVFNLLERPPYTLLRRLLRSSQPVTIKLRIIWLLLTFSLRQKNMAPVLLHNDLAFSNVMTCGSGEPYLLDFEDSVYEKTWLLMDYVDVHFDRDSLTLDFEAAHAYLQQLLEALNINTTDVLAEPMVRLCLIRHALYSAENPDFDTATRSTMAGFLATLAGYNSYQRWRSNSNAVVGG